MEMMPELNTASLYGEGDNQIYVKKQGYKGEGRSGSILMLHLNTLRPY
jgi:hypothetical protein